MALIKCEECGQMVSDKAEMCPNCGCPIENKSKQVENSRIVPFSKGNNRMWVIITAVLVVIIAGAVCWRENSSIKYGIQYPNAELASEEIEEIIPEKIKKATSLEEIGNLIDGTTWHYTENLTTSEIGGWLKVSFEEGRYITYYAKPSDGQWTKGGEGKYDISEGRYSNTGKKYFAVEWKGDMNFEGITLPCEMVMTISGGNFQLNVKSSFVNSMNALTMGINKAAYYAASHKPKIYTGEMEFGDYSWDN